MTDKVPENKYDQTEPNEEFFMFRFVKVLYFLSLAIAFLFSVGLFFLGEAYITGLIVFAVAYVVLNIFREGALYLVFGKKISWEWLSFQKRLSGETKNSIEVDPSGAAAFLLSLMLEHNKPFFKDEDIYIEDEKLKIIVSCALAAYTTYVYLDLIRSKYGKEVSQAVRENMKIILNRKSDLGNQLYGLVNIVENAVLLDMRVERDKMLARGAEDIDLIAIYFLLNMKESPHYITPEQREDQDHGVLFDRIIEECDEDGSYSTFISYLKIAKKSSYEMFTPMVNAMEFKHESIMCLRTDKDFEWSLNPGCYEGFLKRKYFNPLIDTERKKYITQDLINDAKAIDASEITQLAHEIDDFYKSIQSDLDPIDPHGQLGLQREKIEKLIEKCYETGGQAIEFTVKLDELYGKTIECWKILISNNSEQSDALEKAEAYTNSINEIFRNEFVRQISRLNSPYSNSLFEIALFESPSTLRSYIRALNNDPKTINLIKLELTKLIEKAKAESVEIPMLDEKVEIITMITATCRGSLS
ncbi:MULTISPECIES: hypothetical protein [Legionella]|uniref:hypothetical protein n=1 Tax=Legionella TaxID=445 RepID=UPI001041097A|nr:MULTISPECIES: hypothetical protein [Legionella]